MKTDNRRVAVVTLKTNPYEIFSQKEKITARTNTSFEKKNVYRP